MTIVHSIVGQSRDHGHQISEIGVMRKMLDSLENHEERITNLEDTMRVNAVQESILTEEVNKVAVRFMSGKQAPAYKDRSIRGRVYSAINTDIRRQFGVRRREIPAKEFQYAVDFIRGWMPNVELRGEIQTANGSLS